MESYEDDTGSLHVDKVFRQIAGSVLLDCEHTT